MPLEFAVPLRVARMAKRGLLVALAAAAGLALACIGFSMSRETPFKVETADPPSETEKYCAWYGDDRDAVLYFGQAAFWSAYYAHGEDPTADMLEPGPQLIGRFDLNAKRMLSPIDVTAPDAHSGVWDVLAHPNGRIYFTTYFEQAGYYDLREGRIKRFEEAGTGLNELSMGPSGRILVTRYAGADEGPGSVVMMDEEGRILEEWALVPTPGYRTAAKSVAWDPVRKEIWVNTDLIPLDSRPPRYDARVLDLLGREQVRIEDPEIQFVAFDHDGTGVIAEVDSRGLILRGIHPGDKGGPRDRGRRILADEFFRSGYDFVQDVKFDTKGDAVVTRWSGRLHILSRGASRVENVRAPKLEAGSLYYTGVFREGGLCATLCGDVSVVCVGAGGR